MAPNKLGSEIPTRKLLLMDLRTAFVVDVTPCKSC